MSSLTARRLPGATSDRLRKRDKEVRHGGLSFNYLLLVELFWVLGRDYNFHSQYLLNHFVLSSEQRPKVDQHQTEKFENTTAACSQNLSNQSFPWPTDFLPTGLRGKAGATRQRFKINWDESP